MSEDKPEYKIDFAELAGENDWSKNVREVRFQSLLPNGNIVKVVLAITEDGYEVLSREEVDREEVEEYERWFWSD